MGLVLQHKQEKARTSFPCSVSGGAGYQLVPYMGLEPWLRWSAHPLGGAVCRDQGSWVWGLFASCSQMAPSAACTQLFLVPSSFFEFHGSQRHLFQGKHCSKGSQVPACLSIRGWRHCVLNRSGRWEQWGDGRSLRSAAIMLAATHTATWRGATLAKCQEPEPVLTPHSHLPVQNCGHVT